MSFLPNRLVYKEIADPEELSSESRGNPTRQAELPQMLTLKELVDHQPTFEQLQQEPRTANNIQDEIAKRAGLAALPLIREGEIGTKTTEALRSSFDCLWESLDWDYYDVRDKEAKYVILHDDQLKKMDATSIAKLMRDYYEGVDIQKFLPMVEAIARVKKNQEHAAYLSELRPNRKKAVSRFNVKKGADGKWESQQTQTSGMTQVVVENDVRAVNRVYGEVPHEITSSPAFQLYLQEAINTAMADPSEGMDVPIQGNDTGQLTEINKTILQPGQYLDQRDEGTNLWHDITPFTISDSAENKEYRRDIIGLGIYVKKRNELGEPIELDLEAWYMSTTARKGQSGDNAPEGDLKRARMPHQDGFVWIGNLCIRRDKEIQGGESILYHRDANAVKRESEDPAKSEQQRKFKALVAEADRFLLEANKSDDHSAAQNYQNARAVYQRAILLRNEYKLGQPQDDVKIIDSDGNKFILRTLEQGIKKIDEILVEIELRGEFWVPPVESADGKIAHIPFGLALQQQYPKSYMLDERRFEVHDPSGGDIGFFKERLSTVLSSPEGRIRFSEIIEEIGHQLIRSLGRAPSQAEILREYWHQTLFRQAELDAANQNSAYHHVEVQPQRNVIQKRAEHFPEDATDWETAPARLETGIVETPTGPYAVERLIISIRNAMGQVIEHPVMTNEEMEWVEGSAKMIAQQIGKEGKVFIAGLGQGLLNKELSQLGVEKQIVAEINHNVIAIVGPRVKKENGKLQIRQGDWKQVLEEAVAKGETFDAVSIDAYPNSADEVNRDASSREVIELAWKALKPGGVLTFYPDSRYIPARILHILDDMEVPRSAVHYTVESFKTSEFTKEYHYGDLMSVPCIKKPLLENKSEIQRLMEMVKAEEEEPEVERKMERRKSA
jgi:spermidine synthase